MTNFQRIKNILIAIILIVFAVILASGGKSGYVIVLYALGITLMMAGFRSIIYYISMARHMVDGKMILFRGFLILDIGLFTMTLSDLPKFYITLYLIFLYLVYATISILRAFEAKKMGSPWQYNLGYGIFCLMVCVACGIFMTTNAIAEFTVYVYCFGLAYSGILRLISAFRKSSIVFIENQV